ncbi:MAG: HDIG domain-containing metalloprotein [bacterium]
MNERISRSRRIKLLIVIISLLLIVLMFPKGESLEYEVAIGSIWMQDDLISSQTFEILKETEVYNTEVANAEKEVNLIFVRDNGIPRVALDSLKNYSNYLIRKIDEDIFDQEINNSSKTFLAKGNYQALKNTREKENRLLADNKTRLSTFFAFCENLIEHIYQKGLLNRGYDEINEDTFSVRDGKFEKVFAKNNFYDPGSALRFFETNINKQFGDDESLNAALVEYIYHFALPDIIYSTEETNKAKEQARNSISQNVGFVNENERIVAKHDRITKEIKRKIDSYRVAKGVGTGFWGRFAQNLGKFLHTVLIMMLFSIYIFLFRKKIFYDNAKILLISIVILFVCFITFLVQQIEVQAPVEFLIIVPVAPMLITIIFDSRIGFYSVIVSSLITGALVGNDYTFTLMNIVAGGLAAYTVRDIKNRTQIFRSFFYILIGYVISIVAFGLERYSSVENILMSSAFAASNALISPILTYGLIIFVEKIFKITTDLTLLELSDFNSPILRQLAKNAPGTFTHSVTIGSLVENAAQAIGASPILARVGAYYHDVGKSLNPESFVENQMGGENPHAEMEPEKSAALIIEHVKEGIKLAEEDNLPQVIIDFIPMHHGTMVVSYFYETAKNKYGLENVDIMKYRYPGPKPNTKETALVMLADACESTVRSMSDPEPQKVENVINNLFKNRIEDNQLDECPLTLHDLNKIKESFLKILISHHHKRIRYPNQDKMESSRESMKT